MSHTSDFPGPLIRYADHASRHPAFLGYHLAALRREYGQDFASQAEALGLDPLDLARLALCRMPANALDLANLASVFGLEPEALGEMLLLDLLG